MLNAKTKQSGTGFSRAGSAVVNQRIDSLARRAGDKFLISRESMAGGSASVVPSGEFNGERLRGGSSWDERRGLSVESIFSESQRDEVREIFRAALIEAAAAVDFEPLRVPSSWAVVHRRGGFSVWLPGGRVSPSLWAAARSEGSRRAARFLYRESETGEATVSLDELIEAARHSEAHQGEGERSPFLGAAWDGSRADRLADCIRRHETGDIPGGEWASVAEFSQAAERAGFVSVDPWEAGERAAIMARAFDFLASATAARRSEVRGFVSDLRGILVDGEPFPDGWREDGKPDTIARAVRRRAASVREAAGGDAWLLSVAAARHEAAEIQAAAEIRAANTARALAARARASAASRAALRAAVSDRFPAYAGAAVSVVVSPVRCFWLPGCAGLVPSRCLTVTAKPGAAMARPSWSSPVPRGGLNLDPLSSVWKPRPIAFDSVAVAELVRIAQRETKAGTGARSLAVWSAWRAARSPQAVKAWRRRQRRAARK